MVFWKTYPICNIFHSICNRELFKSQIFNKEAIESPTGLTPIIIKQNQNINYISKVREFIKNNFGSPPKTPILDIPEKYLLSNNDHIFIIKDSSNNIAGCIRYHYLGIFITFRNIPIYCVDCFCINKLWRKKGVGDYLLTKLHNYVNDNNIPYCMFLKEGRNLNIIHAPLYSSIYVYRELYVSNKSENVKSLTVKHAYKLIDFFREICPHIFIIYNIDSKNQIWKLYKKHTYKVLVCFQNVFQEFEENGRMKKIAWITAWIESPNMTDKQREEASKELSDTMYPDFNYIWMNRVWSGNSNIWRIDGPFHWYSYQWTTCINIKKSYCLLN